MIYRNQGRGFELGYNVLVDSKQESGMMGVDFGILKMNKNYREVYQFSQEVVYDLLCGKVTFKWNDTEKTVERHSCFHEGAFVLHVPQNTSVEIISLSDDAEVAISRTANDRMFEGRFLEPQDCLDANEMRGSGMMQDCATRIVRTFFDRSNCPETNFFVGEVVHFPGKWSSYPPHIHVEPELYYYKMLPENGYGFSEYGNEALKIGHNDLFGFECEKRHSQVVAPGYSMYYLWCIRLRDEVNINTVVLKDYSWVASEDAKYFPDES